GAALTGRLRPARALRLDARGARLRRLAALALGRRHRGHLGARALALGGGPARPAGGGRLAVRAGLSLGFRRKAVLLCHAEVAATGGPTMRLPAPEPPDEVP